MQLGVATGQARERRSEAVGNDRPRRHAESVAGLPRQQATVPATYVALWGGSIDGGRQERWERSGNDEEIETPVATPTASGQPKKKPSPYRR
eukprot:6681893-Prymnesium_polylepis.1